MSVNGASTGRTEQAGPVGPREPRPDRSGRTVPAQVAPPRLRRRRGVLAAGVMLVALGALGAAVLTQAVGSTVPVVAVVRAVPAGAVLERADLAVANVNVDPLLRPVPASRLADQVGQRAAVALTAGSLLTEQSVTAEVQPAAGRSLVGVALTAAQLPAQALRAGDRVRIIDTPLAQGEPPAEPPTAIVAEVVSVVGPDDTGLTVVDVSLGSDQAADLAARVATGRVALVLDSRER